MNHNRLTSELAEKVMGWKVGPERFQTGSRMWIPRWRFQPTYRIEDAYKLLVAATPISSADGCDSSGLFWARVRVAGGLGFATAETRPLAITIAVAQAVGVTPGARD